MSLCRVLQELPKYKQLTEAACRFYTAEIVVLLEHLHKLGYVYRYEE